MKAQRIKQILAMSALVLVSLGMERVRADFLCSPSAKVPNINNGNGNLGGSISSDGLELYFTSEREGNFNLYVSTRPSTQSDWDAPVKLGPPVNSSYWEHVPSISNDGLSLNFSSDRPGGSGGLDMWVSTRSTTSGPWGAPVNLGPTVNSPVWDPTARISADGLQLLFHSVRNGGLGNEDIWMATRATVDDPWGAPVNLGAPVNSSYSDGEAVLSADGLILFFNSNRAGGLGDYDLWATTRRTVSDPWGTPFNLGPAVNTPNTEWCGSLSADGTTLYFCSDRPNKSGWCSIYQATIRPVVDLNGDEFVDAADMCIMVDRWGTNDPLCDIGPMPWGDGIVDARDLNVLAAHLFEEVLPAELIAYWKLDETDGGVAHNSAGDREGQLNGDPQWRPAGGQMAGALELDGVDDYVGTGCVFNPTDGPFSVFAWIKGGAPGQVIISQVDGIGKGEIWMGTEESSGKLVTGLLPPAGRFAGEPLKSEYVVTDGQWHHVGFIWDCSYRYLYVDSVEVARDTMAWKTLPMKYSDGGLCIGADKTLKPETFFSGLLDDVRVYNKALSVSEISLLR